MPALVGSLAHTRFLLAASAAALVASLPAAPAVARAGDGVPVAVIDTGAELGQAGLAEALWTNPGEIPHNGVDDEGDGIVDDVHGADLVAHDGDPSDRMGHGTEMSNLVRTRARTGVSIMPIKVFAPDASARAETVAAGLDYAVAHGARLALVSLNTLNRTPALEEAVRRAGAAGLLIVASAGNDGRNLDLTPSYPAAYPEANVVAVASLGFDGSLSPFSNWGRRGVDVAARGEDVVTVGLGGHRVTGAGTSEAAAVTAGMAADLAARFPGASGAQLASALARGARPTRGLLGRVAFGQADVDGALAHLGSARASSATHTVRLAGLRATPHAHRLVIRWRASGPANEVLSFRVRAGRRVVTVGAGHSGRRSWRVSVRSGARRVTVVARNTAGRPIARVSGLAGRATRVG